MRQDRDAYVTVNIENVTPISIPLFSKLEWALLDTLGLPYDYGSIMHISGKVYAVIIVLKMCHHSIEVNLHESFGVRYVFYNYRVPISNLSVT